MESFEEIDVEQAKALIDQGNIAIIDIRDPNSYQESHIENAHNVSSDNIEEFINNTDKSKPVLCYCYMGFSSREASQYLKEQGFDKVYNIIGGYTEWQRVHTQGGNESGDE